MQQRHLGGKDEFPDGYLRQGNSIFLFEYKDVLFADSVTEAATFKEITKTIAERFLENSRGEPKGVQQIANHIKFLENNEFEFDNFTKKHRRKSIDIYPVIVYSHNQFSLPGVNHWLNEQAEPYFEGSSFRAIKPVTMISESYLYDFLKMFKDVRLKDILNDYHKTLNSISKKFEKSGRLDYLVKRYGSIEHIRSRLEEGKSFKYWTREEMEEILDSFGVPFSE